MRELSYSEIGDQTGAFFLSAIASAICGAVIALLAPKNNFLEYGMIYSYVPAICLIIMLVICYFLFPEIYLAFISPLLCGTIVGYALSYSIIFWIKILIIAVSPLIVREFFKPKNVLN